MSIIRARGVSLPEGTSGSSFLHELLHAAATDFPDVLGHAGVPDDPRSFKKGFGEALVRFEAARAASARRVEVALAVQRRLADRLRFVDDRGARALSEAVAEPCEPVPVRIVETKGPGRLRPRVTVGQALRGPALRAWLEESVAARRMTEGARLRLQRLLDRADADDGALSLAGERFAILGAAAELSPVGLLLEAGADVLWLDLRSPDEALLARTDLGGTLHVPEEPVDLLADPMRAAATIRRFAEPGPVHLGLYAYAGGEGQEWRLTSAMNAIVGALSPESVRSVTMLISPTTVAVASPEDLAVAERRRASASRVQRALARVGVLSPAGVPSGDTRVPHAIVPLQGASYQAAQYVGKLLAAEAFATHGPALTGERAPLTVSANTAPITNTRSLAHPLFQAGFLAADDFGITISQPVTTVELNGLLAIADVTDPEAYCAATYPWTTPADRARGLFVEQVHGGVFAQPWAFFGVIQMAACIGMARRPSLLRDLVRGPRKESPSRGL